MEKSDIEKYIKKGFPEHWYDYAFELKHAAEVIWKSNSNKYVLYNTYDEGVFHREVFSRTYFLLLGIAIENLLKGILISENPNHLENGKISKEISSGHDLHYLSKQVKTIQFSELELEILKTLSEVIPYWGKYPIPKNFTQLKKEVFMDDDWYKKLINFYEKLESHLLELNYNGIKGPNNIDFPKLRIL